MQLFHIETLIAADVTYASYRTNGDHELGVV